MAHESRAWIATLHPGKRAAIAALYRIEPQRNLIALVFLMLWAAAAILAWQIRVWPLRVGAYLLAGASLHALGILMHEAVHGSFLRRHRLDRWAAFWLGAPVLISATAYRITHLLHHRHNRGPRDPAEIGNYLRSPRLLALYFYVWPLVSTPLFMMHTLMGALQAGTARQRRRVLAEYAGMGALGLGLLWLARGANATGLLLHGWLVPMSIVHLFMSIRGWSEHLLTRAGHPLTQTRTVTTNAVVRFFMCNANYHLEHHLFPAVPWYHLPRVHQILQDEYRDAGASVYRSYWTFLRDAARAGMHGLAPSP